ncbi:hypothetical protein J3R83DRAFT_1363 [Lanmaoa asiatica]|nr:hypothetical protein J3R83DRAFT_1363 [Lanmaoa asiatica]
MAQVRLFPFARSSLTIALRSIVGFVNTYAASVGITNSSWRFYFLYLAVDFMGIFVIYFTFVETGERGLEEMDHIFVDLHPVRASLATHKIALQKTKEGWRERDASGAVRVPWLLASNPLVCTNRHLSCIICTFQI